MTVAAISRKAGPFAGDGSVTAFAFGFKCTDASELVVTHCSTSDVETVLVKDVGYTVSLYAYQDSVPGGVITVSTAPASGEKITITSGISLTQPTRILNAGAFLPQVVEETLDRLEMQIQQQQTEIDRCAKVTVSENITTDELMELLLDGSENNAIAAATSAAAAAASATEAAASAASALATGLWLPKTYRLINVSGTNVWELYAPGGSKIDISSSTTSGMQEMIEAQWVNGGNMEVHGAGSNYTQDYGLLYATTPVVFKPMRNTVFNAYGLHLIVTPNSSSDSGMIIDSCMMGNFALHGEVVYNGNGFAVQIRPTEDVPVDAMSNAIDSDIFVQTIAYISGGSDTYSACLGVSGGNLTQRVRVRCVELNGANGSTIYAKYGVYVANNAAENCTFDIQGIHHVSMSGILNGTSVASTNTHGNVFKCATIQPYGVTAEGFTSWQANCLWEVGVDDGVGSYLRAGVLQTNAAKNIVLLRNAEGFTQGTAMTDNSTGSHIVGSGYFQ